MPSGRIHLKLEIGLLFLLGIGGGVLCWRGVIPGLELGVFLLCYVFSSLFLSPDLDLWESRAVRRWGIGRVLWYPYSKIFRHRRTSHHLVFGPLTRIGYLGGLLLLGAWGWSALTGRGIGLILPRKELIGSILLGLYLPNQVHILVDRAWSRLNRWYRR